MVFPKTVWLVIAAALLISSIGFKKYVWFISLGYGFSIAGIGILLLALYGGRLTAGTAICCVLFVLYGFRLGGYLLYREVKSSAYNSKMKTEIKDGKSMTFGVKCAIWVTCALLYALQVTPVFYRLANGAGTDAWCIVGAVIMLFGVCFESAADIQKQKLKKINPKRFCDTGLFRIVRCPNYLGEMLFWTGVLVSGANVLRGWQWLPALLGYLGIVFVMFSGARRLELRQNKSYGADLEYQAYVKRMQKKSPLGKDMALAFVIGGLICVAGQAIGDGFRAAGLNTEDAGTATSVSLVFLSALLTGLGLYHRLARFGGAGTLVPITGFANAVVSPALDFKAEGFVTGMAAKMFVIAGPVIVYGTLASVVYGVVLWALG